MVTRLSDAIVPEVFSAYMLKETMQKAPIFESGAIRMDPDFVSKLAGGGSTFQVPHWNDLDDTESDVANDDPDDHAAPGKITSGKTRAIRQFRTRGWSSARLVAELAGSDPQMAIASRVGAYWARQFNRIVVSTLTGVFNDNIANDGGDMVLDLTGEAGEAAKMSADAILEGKQTMGDESGALKLLIIHSRIYTNLQKQNLIEFIPNSRGEVNIPTYLGYQVLQTDTVPVSVDEGTGDVTYTSYLLGEGVLGWGESPPAEPVEVDSKPSAAKGSGVQELWTRRQFALHPYGFDWTDAAVVGEFPTNAELANGANWNRVYPERKMFAMAAILTLNG